MWGFFFPRTIPNMGPIKGQMSIPATIPIELLEIKLETETVWDERPKNLQIWNNLNFAKIRVFCR